MVFESKLPLPDECIDHILTYLVDERQTLHALLLSSYKLFRRTAPILYRSPFLLINQSSRWDKDEKTSRSTVLLALLLTSRLSSQLELDEATSTWSPSPLGTLTAAGVRALSQRQQRTISLDFLRYYTFQYHVDLYRSLLELRSTNSETGVPILSSTRTMAELHYDVAFDLLQYSTENIRVISQPLERIPMLVNLIDRLRNLVRLELFGFYGYQIDSVIDFIRVHDQRHKKLREIKIKGIEDPQAKIVPAHKQLARIVQAMKNAEVVDARHWREAILVLERIPVDCLKTLLLSMAEPPPNYFSVADYLSRCRHLEEVRMPVRDDCLFLWAANERELERHGAAAALSRSRSSPPMTFSGVHGARTYPYANSGLGTSTSSLGWQLQRTLHLDRDMDEPDSHQPVRLRSLELCGEDRCLIPALQNAVDAFRDSLEILKAQSLAMMMDELNPYLSGTPLTWSWPMTRLSVLDLEGEIAATFDFAVLVFCPVLTTLRLSLPTFMYSSSEDVHYLDEMSSRMYQICNAKRLQVLELIGKWPVTDMLLKKIAEDMKQLTKLNIVSCSEYTVDGLQILVRNLDRLETLLIHKWFRPQSRDRLLQTIQALNPRLDLQQQEQY
ncbi:hypothetical protein BGX31_006223 [Mortierella sp. GBA43]|nr:hypothetical protein BGX31_006223 [Mortierella sp. GBA43]